MPRPTDRPADRYDYDDDGTCHVRAAAQGRGSRRSDPTDVSKGIIADADGWPRPGCARRKKKRTRCRMRLTTMHASPFRGWEGGGEIKGGARPPPPPFRSQYLRPRANPADAPRYHPYTHASPSVRHLFAPVPATCGLSPILLPEGRAQTKAIQDMGPAAPYTPRPRPRPPLPLDSCLSDHTQHTLSRPPPGGSGADLMVCRQPSESDHTTAS